MKKQKHGFWVFIFSLIPGAGEMYMDSKTGNQYYAAVLGSNCTGFHYRPWMAGHVSPCDMVLQFLQCP